MTIETPNIGRELPAIRQLDEAAINRIAAGEVVERPASAVKELVENALDAGARRVVVDYADVGKTLIRVTDDGCGMTAADLPLALARHATSKIDGSDLLNIHSFGFRGEALPSLGAVGRLTITSRVAGAEAAMIAVAGGRVEPVRPAALSRGTVVEIDALVEALKSGHIAGAAMDVFPKEPADGDEKFKSPLQGLRNVILTPHIGGSTEEAQANIGAEVAEKLVKYSDNGSTLGAVNFVEVALPPQNDATRFMHIHRDVPGVLSKITDVFARRKINIAGQYLRTDGDIGYVVTDVMGRVEVGMGIRKDLAAIEGTVRTRFLYEAPK